MPAGSYIDTSFLAKLYIYEQGSNECAELVRALQGQAFISALSDIEVIASISRSYKDSLVLGMRAIDDYREDCTFGILTKLILDDEVFSEAEDIAERYTVSLNLRSLDIIHLATAKRYGIGSIATFDKRLREAALTLGLTVLPA